MSFKPRYTQADVAKRAGVSQAMVSYVVNNNPNVKIPAETRQRILEVMTELGYVPNSLARGLRSGQTRTIGLLVPDNSNPFFAEIARVIENLGFENDYSVILCNSDYNLLKENIYVDVLLAKQVDGVIFFPAGAQGEARQKLINSGTAFVVIDHDITGATSEPVKLDYLAGGYLATRHLLELGHRRIACLTGPAELSSSAERLAGYLQALAEAGCPSDPDLIVPGDFRIHGGAEAMLRLLKLPQPPSALFACNDLMAIGAIQATHSQGLRVPEDISIIGFDDIPLAQAVYPTLSTMAHPISEIARIAMGIFLQQVQGKSGDQPTRVGSQAVLQPQLVVRDSTSLVKASHPTEKQDAQAPAHPGERRSKID